MSEVQATCQWQQGEPGRRLLLNEPIYAVAVVAAAAAAAAVETKYPRFLSPAAVASGVVFLSGNLPTVMLEMVLETVSSVTTRDNKETICHQPKKARLCTRQWLVVVL
jgi:hypothetical protein